MLAIRGDDIECQLCGEGTGAYEVVVGFETFGTRSVVTVEAAVGKALCRK